MVQEQQALLREVLDKQKEIQSEQLDLRNQLFTMEDIKALKSETLSSPSETSKKKLRVTRNLSVSYISEINGFHFT